MPSPVNDARIWAVGAGDVARSRSVLSAAERRSARALGGARGALYAAAHATLRRALAEALGVEPSEVEIDRRCGHCGDARHGRPTVVGERVSFSVSYGPRVATIIVAHGVRVGIDVHPVVPSARLHLRACSRAEQALLEKVAPAERDRAIARTWARKEAVAKADGRGLLLPLAAVEVTVAPVGPWTMLWVSPRAPGRDLHAAPRRRWYVQDLQLEAHPEVVVAVAASRPLGPLRAAPWEG